MLFYKHTIETLFFCLLFIFIFNCKNVFLWLASSKKTRKDRIKNQNPTRLTDHRFWCTIFSIMKQRLASKNYVKQGAFSWGLFYLFLFWKRMTLKKFSLHINNVSYWPQWGNNFKTKKFWFLQFQDFLALFLVLK